MIYIHNVLLFIQNLALRIIEIFVSFSHLLSLNALYFDGRKDQTLIIEKKNGVCHRKCVQEEHISMIAEPGSKYVGHTTPKSGKANDVKEAIITYLNNTNIQTDNLVAIGGDGTAVNTGPKNGIFRLMEIYFCHPLQWFVCQLHQNELPLRHLFEKLDGKTTGPGTFTGSIGKQLKMCHQLPVVKYKKIGSSLSDMTGVKLSADQDYLYNIVHAVSNGQCSVSLANKYPGNISHARWLNTANNILRLYIGTQKPSDELITLVTFICKSYAPTWFKIKHNNICTDGAKNLWFLAKSSRYLPQNLKNIIDPVIQRNGFFGHPENILIAMLNDKKKSNHEFAVKQIEKARTNSVTYDDIRIFKLPQLNLDAEDYTKLIDWDNCVITEPPITCNMSIKELKEKKNFANVFNYPCHTQAVERCVQVNCFF